MNEQSSGAPSEPIDELPYGRNPDWLSSCHGFKLEAAGKRVGVIEEVLLGDEQLPAALLIRGGLFGNKVFIVAVEDVVDVIPRSKRIVVEKHRSRAQA